MVGRCDPLSGATFSVRPLLAVLTIRQQATPRFRSLKPYHLPGPDRARPHGYPAGAAARRCQGRSGPEADTIFQGLGFSRANVAPRSLQALPPLLYEAHRRNIASI